LNKATETKRRQLVVGNWKMNGNQRQNAELLSNIVAGLTGICVGDCKTEVVVCPPHPYLQDSYQRLAASPLLLGAQNLSQYGEGAHTGEVSARMLVDLHCRYVILGHSERRKMQGETDAQIAQKFVAAQGANLVPILCVGESLAEREQGQYLQVVAKQLDSVFAHTGREAFAQAVIAYEPVWAIGTGKTASPEQADEVHKFIRKHLGSMGASVRILYGGSVKADTAAGLFKSPDIDGALLGGASLNAQEFLSICKAAELSSA
jgi:triosephosphate isomerase (TIM)